MKEDNKVLPKKSSKWRDFLGEFAGSMFGELLVLLLGLIPIVVIAWVWIAWGSMWLLFPVVFSILLFFIWLFKRFRSP